MPSILGLRVILIGLKALARCVTTNVIKCVVYLKLLRNSVVINKQSRMKLTLYNFL